MGGSGHRVVDAIGSMDYQVHVADVVGEGGEASSTAAKAMVLTFSSGAAF